MIFNTLLVFLYVINYLEHKIVLFDVYLELSQLLKLIIYTSVLQDCSFITRQLIVG